MVGALTPRTLASKAREMFRRSAALATALLSTIDGSRSVERLTLLLDAMEYFSSYLMVLYFPEKANNLAGSI
jgi:dolichyl-phosphate-mannose--protein O-mannosyl transferase